MKTLLNERKKKLKFERNVLIQQIIEQIKYFNDSIQMLVVERHEIIAQLKLGINSYLSVVMTHNHAEMMESYLVAELKLFILFKEYKLLLTFEGKLSLSLILSINPLTCVYITREGFRLTNETTEVFQ